MCFSGLFEVDVLQDWAFAVHTLKLYITFLLRRFWCGVWDACGAFI